MEALDRINIWRRGDQRAPHKPLLLLIALGRVMRGQNPEVPFVEVEPLLRQLLIEFGPPRKSHHPEYPFWHLQQDGLWEVKSKRPVSLRKGSSNPSKSELIESQAVGTLCPALLREFRDHPELVLQGAKEILHSHFPTSLHEEIAAAVGINLETSGSSKRARDPAFRSQVLVAYEYRCAVCALDVRIGSVTVGIEAAHIEWYQAGGPDTPSNGLALCSLHHKLLDLGAFTILDDLRVVVSTHAHGGHGFDDLLLAYHGKLIRKPQRSEWRPLPSHLGWHRQEVFKGEGRELA